MLYIGSSTRGFWYISEIVKRCDTMTKHRRNNQDTKPMPTYQQLQKQNEELKQDLILYKRVPDKTNIQLTEEIDRLNTALAFANTHTANLEDTIIKQAKEIRNTKREVEDLTNQNANMETSLLRQARELGRVRENIQHSLFREAMATNYLSHVNNTTMKTKFVDAKQKILLLENVYDNITNWQTYKNNVKGSTCSICQERILMTDKTYNIACCHSFHCHCFISYVLKDIFNHYHKSLSCPLCRETIIIYDMPYVDTDED